MKTTPNATSESAENKQELLPRADTKVKSLLIAAFLSLLLLLGAAITLPQAKESVSLVADRGLAATSRNLLATGGFVANPNNFFGILAADSFTWTKSTSVPFGQDWRGIASSADGSKLAAAANDGIWTSANSGVTWTAVSGTASKSWRGIASSSDGSMVYAVGWDGIHKSTNSGGTFTKTSAPSAWAWGAIGSSSDGSKLVAAIGNYGGLYASADSGGSWTISSSAPTKYWTSVASSADGSKVAAVHNSDSGPGAIYASTDSGSSWTKLTSAPSLNWISIACSSDGSKLAAADGTYSSAGGTIWTSANSGGSWARSTSAPAKLWRGITSSADGLKLAAVAESSSYYGHTGGIWVSADSGATWTQTSTLSYLWATIVSSSDGSKLTAGTRAGGNPEGLFTGKVIPATSAPSSSVPSSSKPSSSAPSTSNPSSSVPSSKPSTSVPSSKPSTSVPSTSKPSSSVPSSKPSSSVPSADPSSSTPTSTEPSSSVPSSKPSSSVPSAHPSSSVPTSAEPSTSVPSAEPSSSVPSSSKPTLLPRGINNHRDESEVWITKVFSPQASEWDYYVPLNAGTVDRCTGYFPPGRPLQNFERVVIKDFFFAKGINKVYAKFIVPKIDGNHLFVDAYDYVEADPQGAEFRFSVIHSGDNTIHDIARHADFKDAIHSDVLTSHNGDVAVYVEFNLPEEITVDPGDKLRISFSGSIGYKGCFLLTPSWPDAQSLPPQMQSSHFTHVIHTDSIAVGDESATANRRKLEQSAATPVGDVESHFRQKK